MIFLKQRRFRGTRRRCEQGGLKAEQVMERGGPWAPGEGTNPGSKQDWLRHSLPRSPWNWKWSFPKEGRLLRTQPVAGHRHHFKDVLRHSCQQHTRSQYLPVPADGPSSRGRSRRTRKASFHPPDGGRLPPRLWGVSAALWLPAPPHPLPITQLPISFPSKGCRRQRGETITKKTCNRHEDAALLSTSARWLFCSWASGE